MIHVYTHFKYLDFQSVLTEHAYHELLPGIGFVSASIMIIIGYLFTQIIQLVG